MDDITLTETNEHFYIDKCIICQKPNNLKTSENGRKRMRDAAAIRQDSTAKRLRLINEETTFYYHLENKCYKTYTHSKDLKRLAEVKPKDKSVASTSTEENTAYVRESRSQSCCRAEANPKSLWDVRNMTCIICDKQSYHNERMKYRIAESDKAKSFLKAANFFKDDVFTRICDLQDEFAVFGADLYYHRQCMSSYSYSYDHRSSTKTDHVTAKKLAWNTIVQELTKGLRDGRGYELSSIRDHLNKSSTSKETIFTNRDVKIFLMGEFEDTINFSYPDSSKKSLMVYSLDHDNADYLNYIRSINPIQVCASVIRSSFNEYDSGLTDRFCDATDLKQSCVNMSIPDPVLKFLGYLYDFNPTTYSKAAEQVTPVNNLHIISEENEEHEENEEDDEEDEDSSPNRNLSVQRCRKMQSIFQILYYTHHCGKKRTPLHIMNAEFAHNLGHGGKIFTSVLNRTGLALSYSALRRYQYDMAQFTALKNKETIALPSHFDPAEFTSGSTDNWDHESENSHEHDTVCILYQNKSRSEMCKPKISDTAVKHGPKAFKGTLPCQVLKELKKPVRHANIPHSYTVDGELYNSDAEVTARVADRAWSISRLDLTAVKVENMKYPSSQTMPSWSAANSVWTKEDVPVKNIAFLPVLPHPITKYDTVYTVMKNMVSICSLLEQDAIPLYADEKVYCMAKEIQFLRPQEFSCLFLCLGTFHTAKTVMKCIGKSLTGSGAEAAWLNSGVHGPAVIDHSILNATHYNRALSGLSQLAEAMQRLQYQEFFRENNIAEYSHELSTLQNLKNGVTQNNIKESQKYINIFTTESNVLLSDIDNFIRERSSKNENFMFWSQFITRLHIVKDLLRADREGNWELHIDSLQRAIFEFAAWDSTNYLRWASIYI